jgi:nicotinamidase-related amidase
LHSGNESQAPPVSTKDGRTALLLMDLMPIMVPAFGGDDAMVERLAGAAEAARSAGVEVIHVRIAFRDGYPDVAPSNKIFAATISHFDFTAANPDTGIHPGLRHRDSDLVVLKKRVSGFAGSDLELVLRSRGIRDLVLAGVTTSGVVLSTLRAAADLDYGIAVLADGCGDGDAEVHDLLMEKVFPAHAEVMQTAEWVDSLGARATDPPAAAGSPDRTATA